MSKYTDFRRYVEREKNKRKGAFFYNFEPDEGQVFQEEMRYLRSLGPAEKGTAFAPLQRDVELPDQLTDQQLDTYLSLLPQFRQEEFQKKEHHYGNLYLLQLANVLEDTEPSMALRRIFRFRDEMHMSVDNNAYFMDLCDSFLIAYPQLQLDMQSYRRARGLGAHRNLYEEIQRGIFDGASLYVKEHGRLLKEKDISGEKAFQFHTWKAMPDMFYALDRQFRAFRAVVTAGQEERKYLRLLPVKGVSNQNLTQITQGEGMTLYKEKSYGKEDRWYRKEWDIFDSSGDFLTAIYQYGESFMRERLGAARKARSAARIMNKNYRRKNDTPRNIRDMKGMLGDKVFEETIARGVDDYLRAHPEVLEEQRQAKAQKERAQEKKRAGESRKRREAAKAKQKQEIYEMDHERVKESQTIDPERLKQARKEMDSLLDLLHVDTINYE